MAAQASKVQPTEAAQLLEAGYTYLDVRTPQEFAAGHVKESVNIPLMLSTPQGMQPNPDFLQQVKQQFPQGDEQLIVGCKAGNRSARACAMLAEENYSTLADQTGGFDGWVTANLPVVQ